MALNALKRGRLSADKHRMRPHLASSLLLGLLLTAAPELRAPSAETRLVRGDDNFWLGMSRVQVDSAVTARRDAVISSGAEFLVCGSPDPAIEYVEYSFLQAPHGLQYLWQVTIGYQRTASTTDFANAREGLIRMLGDPVTDSWKAGDEGSRSDSRPAEMNQLVAWADPMTIVRLGARWTNAPDSSADRMLVSWTDRRLQRVVEAGAMKIVKRRRHQPL